MRTLLLSVSLCLSVMLNAALPGPDFVLPQAHYMANIKSFQHGGKVFGDVKFYLDFNKCVNIEKIVCNIGTSQNPHEVLSEEILLADIKQSQRVNYFRIKDLRLELVYNQIEIPKDKIVTVYYVTYAGDVIPAQITPTSYSNPITLF